MSFFFILLNGYECTLLRAEAVSMNTAKQRWRKLIFCTWNPSNQQFGALSSGSLFCPVFLIFVCGLHALLVCWQWVLMALQSSKLFAFWRRPSLWSSSTMPTFSTWLGSVYPRTPHPRSWCPTWTGVTCTPSWRNTTRICLAWVTQWRRQ